MTIAPKKPQSEREQTDEYLLAEREGADATRAAVLASSQVAADNLVARARTVAQAVLDLARETADHVLAAPASDEQDVAAARARADALLDEDRKSAYTRLRSERKEHARALAARLPFERERTDQSLLIERAHSDDTVAHRDDFLGIVSHDLRNLLGSIVVESVLLEDWAAKTKEGQRAVEGMKRVQRLAARMNRLIGDLSDVVSIEAGKLAIERVRYDAVVLVAEAVEAFAHVASEKGIALEAEAPAEGALLASFDSERMLQVLANLIANALRFTPRGGRITVGCERGGGGELRLSVSDTGAGISGDCLESIFERFGTVGAKKRERMGLGLYISRSIVEAHGGRIWAESTPDVGSTFRLILPGPVPSTDDSSA